MFRRKKKIFDEFTLVIDDVHDAEEKWVEQHEAIWLEPNYERCAYHGVVVWEKRYGYWLAFSNGHKYCSFFRPGLGC